MYDLFVGTEDSHVCTDMDTRNAANKAKRAGTGNGNNSTSTASGSASASGSGSGSAAAAGEGTFYYTNLFDRRTVSAAGEP